MEKSKRKVLQTLLSYLPLVEYVIFALLVFTDIHSSLNLSPSDKELLFYLVFFFLALLPLSLQLIFLRKNENVVFALSLLPPAGAYFVYFASTSPWDFLLFLPAVTISFLINSYCKGEHGRDKRHG